MFQVNNFQKAKLKFVDSLTSKDREPGTNPGLKLKFEMSMTNEFLIHLDPKLREVLYQKASDGAPTSSPQASIDGLPPLPTLTPIGASLKRLKWHPEFTGMGLEVQYGTGRKESNVWLADCTVYDTVLICKPGAATDVKFTVEAPNVPDAVGGKFLMLKDTELEIRVTPPKIVADLVDKAQEPEKVAKAKPEDKEKVAPLTPEKALAKALQQAEATT